LHFGDRQNNGQTDKQMDRTVALSRERRLNNRLQLDYYFGSQNMIEKFHCVAEQFQRLASGDVDITRASVRALI